jgi:hypothetical protein
MLAILIYALLQGLRFSYDVFVLHVILYSRSCKALDSWVLLFSSLNSLTLHHLPLLSCAWCAHRYCLCPFHNIILNLNIACFFLESKVVQPHYCWGWRLVQVKYMCILDCILLCFILCVCCFIVPWYCFQLQSIISTFSYFFDSSLIWPFLHLQGTDAFSQSGLYSNHQDIGPRYSVCFPSCIFYTLTSTFAHGVKL